MEDEGLWARLTAGTAFGVSTPLAVNSPLFYVHAELQPGARRGVPAEHAEKAAYVAWARVEVDGQGCRLDQTMVFVLPAVAHWLAPVREAEEPNP